MIYIMHLSELDFPAYELVMGYLEGRLSMDEVVARLDQVVDMMYNE